MSLIIIEGLDRTGKSTVAGFFESQGYTVVHLGPPKSDISPEEYKAQIIELLLSSRDEPVGLVLDRSHYGELVWPYVYNREPKLSKEDIISIREIEKGLNVQRILMHDTDIIALWNRCVENNEPLNKSQFNLARKLFYSMADEFNFTKKTLKDFINQTDNKSKPVKTEEALVKTNNNTERIINKTPQQIKLERANAINHILSKRIIKQTGEHYDFIEDKIRHFLNSMLDSLFSSNNDAAGLESLSQEEIKFYKALYKKIVNKV